MASMFASGGNMRKLWLVLIALSVLGAIGNLIGGTDTPVTAAVDPARGAATVRADVPAAPRFDATMYVSASSLNLREAPTTGGRVLTTLPRNTPVLAGERRGNWVLVSANGRVGWVSGAISPVRQFRLQSPCRRRPNLVGAWRNGPALRPAHRASIARGSAHARKRGGT